MIFLVGASWIPLGFLAARTAGSGSSNAGRSLRLPVVLAMQVLGGDPEAAYLTVIFASAYAVGLVAASARWGAASVVRWGIAGLITAYFVLLGLTWWAARVRFAASMGGR